MENKLEERTAAEKISNFANLFWHWAWLMVLCILLAGGTTYWESTKQTPVYEASTTISVDVAPTSQTVTASSLSTSEDLAATYAQEMVMQPMLDGVAKRLGLAAFPLTASVQVTPITNTQLIKVDVQYTDPKQAAQFANTLVQVFSDKLQADQASRYTDTKVSIQAQMATLDNNIQTAISAVTEMKKQIQETTNELNTINDKIQTEITNTKLPLVDPATIDADKNTRDQLQITLVQYQSQLSQLQTTQSQYQQSYNNLFQSNQEILVAEAQSSSTVIQQNPAVPSDIPIKPKPVTNAILAAVICVMIAMGGIFLIDFLDDTIRDPEEITRRWGVPILGTIISYPHENDTLITAKQPRSPITEAFRTLRTNLQFTSFTLPVHTILVTSPSPEDGKTTVSTNLASVIAQGGRRAVIVDADLRRPRVHKLLKVSNRNGLSDQFIRNSDILNNNLKPTEIKGLYALTSGNLPPNPSELLSSDRMSKILHELASHFDMVIVDAPPVLLVTDALVLATYVDGVLIVIKPSNTKWAAMKNLLEQMHQVNANILGIVINDVKVNRSSYYNQKYNSHYNYFETGSEPSEDPKIPAAKEASNVPNFLKITESAQKKKNDSPVITGKVE